MDTQALRTWLKALRSGEYKQTTHALYDGEGHCCLGVACEVFGLGDSWEQLAITNKFKRMGVRDPENDDWVGLPGKELAELFGSVNPEVRVIEDAFDSLVPVSELNDAGWSFYEIAEALESWYIEGVPYVYPS